MQIGDAEFRIGRLANASEKLAQYTILERWPEDADKPDRSTLLRWLSRATRQGVICRAGSGFRGSPFRYWLPGYELLLWPGAGVSNEEKAAWRERRHLYANGLYTIPTLANPEPT